LQTEQINQQVTWAPY